MRINSHNEWDKLKEIIVGSAAHSCGVLTWNRPEPVPPDVMDKAAKLAAKSYPKWFLDEVEEDLDKLAATIASFGAKVHRPNVHDVKRMYSTPFWHSTGNNAYNVRDLHLVVGNTVIESPSHVRSRYFEASTLYDVWYEYFEHGFKWIAGPKPRLNTEVLSPYFRDEEQRELTPEDIRHAELTNGRIEKLHRLSENEIMFEAANTLRMGKDLLYLVSCSGNNKGAKWLQSVLGDNHRVHTTEDIYRSSHIDSTVMCLRPGLVMLNSKRVHPGNCPEIFNSWEKLYFEDVAPTSQAELDFQRDVRDPTAGELADLGFGTNLTEMASPWVGMNFLSLDPETVVVDERQTSLIRLLESHKFVVVPVRLRHIYTQGGGIHCATLDTVREGELEDYFS
jgi:N-dimethylarginine dimethylaminohydrolase